ncbi:MAG TPA: oligosaccharide flippase family protein [Firmicutes bacterium]|nr:oligosaccharide flippase family protein [Bacillota bacterium]
MKPPGELEPRRQPRHLRLWQRPLWRSTAALSAVALVNRMAGMAYRALLARLAGAEPLGLFELTAPWRRIAWLTATLELPIALSQLVAAAGARRDHHRALDAARYTLRILLGTTLLTSLLLWTLLSLGGGRLLADRRAQGALDMYPLVLLPAVLASWIRAFLQGYQSMIPTALAQLVEQLARVPAVLFLVSLLLPEGAARVAQGIMIGSAIGEAADLFTLLFLVRRRRAGLPSGIDPTSGAGFIPGRSRRPSRRASRLPPVPEPSPVGRGLFRLALPLVAAHVYASLFQIAYLAVIPRRLVAAGVPGHEFTRFYGQMNGMVFPLLYFPMVLINPLVRVLLPATAAAWERGDHRRLRRLLSLSLSTALALGLIVLTGATTFATPIVTLLYGMEQAGAARLLSLLAWAAPLAFVYHILMAVLNGLGRTAPGFVILIVSSLLRLGVAYHLVADPAWGLDGIIIAILADDAISVALAALALALVLRALPPSLPVKPAPPSPARLSPLRASGRNVQRPLSPRR